MQAAKSSAARRSVTFTLRQGRFTSRNTNRFAVPLRRYSQAPAKRTRELIAGRSSLNTAATKFVLVFL